MGLFNRNISPQQFSLPPDPYPTKTERHTMNREHLLLEPRTVEAWGHHEHCPTCTGWGTRARSEGTFRAADHPSVLED